MKVALCFHGSAGYKQKLRGSELEELEPLDISKPIQSIKDNLRLTKNSKYFIAPSGKIRQSISNLPGAALRLEIQTEHTLARLGLRQIGDVINQPRASLNRRFCCNLLKRVDQARGSLLEPISPLQPELNFGVRISFPDPIGLKPDIICTFS